MFSPDHIYNLACRTDRCGELRELLNAGADPNALNSLGASPSLAAVERNNVDGLRALLSARADPDYGGVRRWPLVHAAAAEKRVKCLAMLLHAGASQLRWCGATPTITAVSNRDAPCVKLLVAAGARLDLKDDWGMVAFDHAVTVRCSLPTLVEHGAVTHWSNALVAPLTPMMRACFRSGSEYAGYLAQHVEALAPGPPEHVLGCAGLPRAVVAAVFEWAC